MKKIFLLFIYLSINNISAQSFLLTNDDNKYEYDKITFKRKFIELKVGKEKKEFEPTEVNGYYSDNDNTFYYRKTNIDSIITYWSNGMGDNYLFSERIIEGKIKVYQKEINIQSGSNSFTYNYWYAEKNKEFFTIHINGPLLPKNKDKFEKLLTLINDSPDLIKSIKDKDYKHNIDDKIEIIKQYNLYSHLKEQNLSSNTLLNKIILYRHSKNQKKEPVIFSIDDKKYKLNENDKLEIDLPTNRETQICIKNDINNTCELIKAHNYFETYYEIDFNRKEEVNVIRQNGNSSFVRAVLKYIDRKQSKNRNKKSD